MKVVLINPNWQEHNVPHTTASLIVPKSVPLELAYVAASIEDHCDVAVIDAYAQNLTKSQIVRQLDTIKPDLVVIDTAPTYLFWRCPPLDLSVPSELSSAVRSSIDTKIGVIGPHGTNDSFWTHSQTGADTIVQGEPDLAFVEIVSSGLIRSTYPNPGPVDLTKLPMPAFDKFDISLYEAHAWLPELQKHLLGDAKINLVLEYSRGCPYSCVYCFKEGFRDEFRTKTLNQMEMELDYISDNGGTYVYFIDEIFNMPSANLKGLLDLLRSKGIAFGNQSRPDLMTEDLVRLMADSGCIYIEYGVEVQDERVAENIKKNVDYGKLERILNVSHELIPVVNEFRINFYAPEYAEILGLPERPVEEWDPKPIRPYPGTFLGEKIFERYGIRENKWDFALRYVWWLQLEREHALGNVRANPNELKSTVLFGSYDRAKDITCRLLK
ncbi:MAG: radical SAM protein [Nanoarchaeota archaeon]|nr:radical SAM protein [Nanoarchaeota archaeon]